MAETGDDDGTLRRFEAFARQLTEVELKPAVVSTVQTPSLRVDAVGAEQSWRDCARTEVARDRIDLSVEVARALGDVVVPGTIP